MERVKGIEPSYSAWEAAALPLSYTRKPAENQGFHVRLSERFTARFTGCPEGEGPLPH